MSAGSYPFRRHLVAMHHAVRHGDRRLGSRSQDQVFACQNRGTSHEGLCMQTILNDGMLGVVVVQCTCVPLRLVSQMLIVQLHMLCCMVSRVHLEGSRRSR